jgi:rubrerythrin
VHGFEIATHNEIVRESMARRSEIEPATIAKITCPACGKNHEMDYPKCPHCGHINYEL